MRVYIVANKPNVTKEIVNGNIKDLVVYTITRKLKHCSEYVNKFLKMKNFQHFLNWCNAHQMSPEQDYSWHKYCSVVVKDQFRDFYVTPINFSKDFICTCLRLLNDCIPVGASYEFPTEVGGFLATHCSTEQLEDIVKELQDLK